MILSNFLLDVINDKVRGADIVGNDSFVRLYTNDVNPTNLTTFDDMEWATFTGGGPIELTTAAQPYLFDAVTGRYGFALAPLAGSLLWICTAAPAEPEIVYGFGVIDGGDNLLASRRLAAPVTVSDVGDYVEMSEVFGFLPVTTYQDDV